jgi:hypothetical protein
MRCSRLIAVSAFVSATAAHAQPLPEGLQKAADCMVRVLITTPGVSNPQIDIDGNGDAVCLSFMPAEKNIWEGGFVHFCLDKNFTSSKPYNFTGIVPGITDTPPNEDSDNHVTISVVNRWNKQCPVGVIAISV